MYPCLRPKILFINYKDLMFAMPEQSFVSQLGSNIYCIFSKLIKDDLRRKDDMSSSRE